VLVELSREDAFRPFRLRFNYRSGARLIVAAEASLGSARNYRPAPDRDHEGEIEFEVVEGGLEAQAARVVRKIVPSLVSVGVEPHEIAVLYKQRGELFDALLNEIPQAAEEYLVEKDVRFPSTPIVRWLQRCASKALGSEDSDPLAELAAPYRDLLAAAGVFDDDLIVRERILDAVAPVDPHLAVSDWMTEFDASLDLRALLEADGTAPDDLASVMSLLDVPTTPIPLSDFPRGVQIHGRVVLTTCHSVQGSPVRCGDSPGPTGVVVPIRAMGSGRLPVDVRSAGGGSSLVLRGLDPCAVPGVPGLLAPVRQPMGIHGRGSVPICG
jgi:DNA helicase-2/ATP-dependent DNA helicase PcrA